MTGIKRGSAVGRRGERAQSSAAKTGGEDRDGEARAGRWWSRQSMTGVNEPRVGTGRAQDPGIRHWRPGTGGAPTGICAHVRRYVHRHMDVSI